MTQFENATGVREVRPRLKTEEDRQALWDMFDCIDMIASDHAPHTMEEKKTGAPGFPGLETSLALLITAYKQDKLTLEQIIQKCYTNPRRIFNLPEQADTYIEVDLDDEWVIPAALPYSKCQWTPFAGLKVYGAVRRVVLRGEVVFVDGQVLIKPGYGQNIASMPTVKPQRSLTQKLFNKNVSVPDLKVDDTTMNATTATTTTLKAPSPLFTNSNILTPSSVAQLNKRVRQTSLSANTIENLTSTETDTANNKLISESSYVQRLDFGSHPLLSSSSSSSLNQPGGDLGQHIASMHGPNAFYRQSLITVDHLQKESMHKLFNLAHDLKILTLSEKDLTHFLRGKVVAEMFFEPSTRTQCSFSAAAQRLGGTVIFMVSKIHITNYFLAYFCLHLGLTSLKKICIMSKTRSLIRLKLKIGRDFNHCLPINQSLFFS